MAIAKVAIGTVASNGGSGNCSPAFGASTTAGNLLIAWAIGEDIAAGSGIAVTGTGWGEASVATNSSSTSVAYVFYRANCGASESAPTFASNTAQIGTIRAALLEISGAQTASPLDQSGSATGNTTPQVATCGAQDTASGALVVAASRTSLSKAGTDTTTHTFNNGASSTDNLNNDASSVVPHYLMSWGVTTGNGSADTVTLADTSMNMLSLAVCMASFKAAAGASTKSPPPVPTRHRDRFRLFNR